MADVTMDSLQNFDSNRISSVLDLGYVGQDVIHPPYNQFNDNASDFGFDQHFAGINAVESQEQFDDITMADITMGGNVESSSTDDINENLVIAK